MAQDAAASGAKSDADSTAKGDQNSDAGTTGDSQPDIDKIVAARVGQVLKSKNIDDLERKAAEFDKLQESKKSDIDKLTERITSLEREKSELESARKQDRIQSTTVRTAAKLGFADPEDAVAFIARSDQVADDGGNVEQLLSDLLKAKPYLSSGRVSGSADGGQRGESTNGKVDENTLIRAALLGRQ